MLRTIGKFLPVLVGGAVGKATAGRGLVGAGIGLVAVRLARRSVPGALLVGGAMVAKHLYDKKKDQVVPPEVTAAVLAHNERAVEDANAAQRPVTPPLASPELLPPAQPASGH